MSGIPNRSAAAWAACRFVPAIPISLTPRHLGELLQGVEPESPAADDGQSDLTFIHQALLGLASRYEVLLLILLLRSQPVNSWPGSWIVGRILFEVEWALAIQRVRAADRGRSGKAPFIGTTCKHETSRSTAGRRRDGKQVRLGNDALTAASLLTELGIPHESKVVSAHRTPDRLFRYGREAEGRGLEVVIAGAGGAAHLPGMLAAITLLPVLGVPVESKTLRGVDSLLVDRADASRRAGWNARHRSLGRGQRGDPGRGDSGAEVSRNPPGLGPVSPGADRRRGRVCRYEHFFRTFRPGRNGNGVLYPPASLGVVGSGQLGRMFIQAAQRMGYRAGVLTALPDDPAAQVAHWKVIGSSNELSALREFAERAQPPSPSSSKTFRPPRCAGWRTAGGPSRLANDLDLPESASREAVSGSAPLSSYALARGSERRRASMPPLKRLACR